jgi:hypothetical protein
MIRELVLERLDSSRRRRHLGRFGPGHDFCPGYCCLPRESRAEVPTKRGITGPQGDPISSS